MGKMPKIAAVIYNSKMKIEVLVYRMKKEVQAKNI